MAMKPIGRNTEINWKVWSAVDVKYHQMVVPSENIYNVEMKFGEIRTGYRGTVRGINSSRVKISFDVDLNSDQMQCGISTEPFDSQLVPESSYTILDWLEINDEARRASKA